MRIDTDDFEYIDDSMDTMLELDSEPDSTAYYATYIECDMCGHQTRGRTSLDDAGVVKCTSCNRMLI